MVYIEFSNNFKDIFLNLFSFCILYYEMKSANIKSVFNPALFWDADDIDPEKHAAYVISRILDFGDFEDVYTLRKMYSDKDIEHAIRTRRSLSPRTGKFWAIKFGIPLYEVTCLKKYYQKKP